MAMEIRINAIEMLKVLVHAGIETTDAKAIIFDLLQYPEKAEKIKEKEIPPRRGRPKKVTTSDETDSSVPKDEVDSDEDETEEDETDEEEDEEKKIILKKPKRVSFKNFGGSSPSIDSIRKSAHAK